MIDKVEMSVEKSNLTLIGVQGGTIESRRVTIFDENSSRVAVRVSSDDKIGADHRRAVVARRLSRDDAFALADGASARAGAESGSRC